MLILNLIFKIKNKKKELYIDAILLPAMSRRWVSALINPFPASDFISAGILQ